MIQVSLTQLLLVVLGLLGGPGILGAVIGRGVWALWIRDMVTTELKTFMDTEAFRTAVLKVVPPAAPHDIAATVRLEVASHVENAVRRDDGVIRAAVNRDLAAVNRDLASLRTETQGWTSAINDIGLKLERLTGMVEVLMPDRPSQNSGTPARGLGSAR